MDLLHWIWKAFYSSGHRIYAIKKKVPELMDMKHLIVEGKGTKNESLQLEGTKVFSENLLIRLDLQKLILSVKRA
jgi:hypothetical protein